MATEQATQTSGSAAGLGGKYLTFILADESYGIEILKVREIMGMLEITTIPRTPDFVKGVINLRGKVIPVIDLRLKFGMEEAEHTEETCIIVVNLAGVEVGTIVDRVSEVLDVAGNDIENAPSFGANVNTDFILGIGKSDDKVTILLDVDKVFSDSDVDALTSLDSNSEGEDA